MKALVLFAAIASVHCGSMRLGRQHGGWGSSTPGWSTPPPTTTTPGWSTPAPTTPGWNPPPSSPGWGSPAPAGWAPVVTNIELDAALAAAGSGWAGEQHSDNVVVTGAGGWGPNADLVISSAGSSIVAQDGSILQVTSQDAENASSLNNVSVGQIAEAQEGQLLEASGIDIINAQSGSAGASGAGASAADALSSLTVNAAGNLGMAKP